MKQRKIILRRKNEDKEDDKYEYFISCGSCEVTTSFKDKATILNEGEEIKVMSKDWKVMLAPKRSNK